VVYVGERAVDHNPAFKLYLVTRNAMPVLTPDVVPLLTVTNFSITHSGLESESQDLLSLFPHPCTLSHTHTAVALCLLQSSCTCCINVYTAQHATVCSDSTGTPKCERCVFPTGSIGYYITYAHMVITMCSMSYTPRLLALP
jgi:hypothetical protein